MLEPVSVVLPCPEPTPPPALERILAQRGVEVEIWLVGPTPPAHPDPRLRRLPTPSAGPSSTSAPTASAAESSAPTASATPGPSMGAAWRRGLARASHPLISFCHPDALWRSDEHLRDAAEALGAHRADLYCGDSTAQPCPLEPGEHPRRQEHPLVVELRLRRALSTGWFPELSAAVIRRRALPEPLCRSGCWPAGWDLMFGALDHAQVRLYRPALLVQHAEAPPSDPIQTALDNAAAAQGLQRRCRHRPMRSEAGRRAAQALDRASRLAAADGAQAAALKHATAAIRADPDLRRLPTLSLRLLQRLKP